MRHKNYVQQINHKDIRLFHALRCCNHLSKEQATSLVSQNRINSFIKQGVILQVRSVRRGMVTTAYAVTPKGRDWAARNIPTLRDTNWYTSATAVEHNIRLAERYIKIQQEQPQSLILTENDLRSFLIRQLEEREDRNQLIEDLREGRLSVPDLGYMRDGVIYCVEVVTENYTSANLAAKAAFSEVTGAPIEYLKG